MGIKKLIKKLAEYVLQSNWFPNKKILLESNPDMGSQTFPVYQYMLQQGLNKKYRIYWFVWDKKKFKSYKEKNVFFVNMNPTGFFEKLHKQYLLWSSRLIVYSHRYIGKIFPKQVFVYLRHGSFIKSRLLHARENEVNECDACVSMSPFFADIEEEQLRVSKDKLIFTGYPTNDYLFDKNNYRSLICNGDKYDKIIIWLPTFRKAAHSDRLDSSFDFPMGLPCLYSEDECQKLNSVLKENNVLLILKPHPAQDLSVIKKVEFSNFKIVSDDDFQSAGIHFYQYLPSTDAMITDYSSIYYDYLLLDKPIGVSVDDIDVYASDTGFVFDDFYSVIRGKYLKNVDDFVDFVTQVADGKDDLLSQRREICDLVHYNKDGFSTQRVYDHMIEMVKERYGNM